jgi:putative hemolysin
MQRDLQGLDAGLAESGRAQCPLSATDGSLAASCAFDEQARASSEEGNMHMDQASHPFRLLPARSRLRPLLAPIERILALDELERRYGRLQPSRDALEFIERALAELQVDVRVAPDELAGVPKSGATIVCANHPFGAVEGLVIARELRRLRPDVKVLVNSLLERIVELRELFLAVDVFGVDEQAANARALRAAIRHLEQGGLLVVFPAGEVSSLRVRTREVTDPPWRASVARMALRTGASTCPAYFDGRNGALFQIAGLLHPRLRTALLPRELVNKRGRTIALRLGSPIPAAELEQLADDAARTDYLRLRTYALGATTSRRGGARPRKPSSGAAPVAPAGASTDWERELARLPSDSRLAAQNGLVAHLARAEQIPALLLEIGRQRELAFRAVGEGTNRPRDLDRHDEHYRHLVLWDERQGRVAGAYRVGATDELLHGGDVSGMYTASLFDYDRSTLRRFEPALELGRSFVAADYQRSYAPLLTMWKGIGAHVARNPRYRHLFGPVSISADYHPLSRQLIAQYLQRHRAAPATTGFRPRTPLELRRVQGLEPRRISELLGRGLDLSALVGDLEGGRKDVPVLLREYLKLGGMVVALNVDPDFNDALDALLVVDLVRTEERLLRRYLGDEGARGFLAHHGQRELDVVA